MDSSSIVYLLCPTAYVGLVDIPLSRTILGVRLAIFPLLGCLSVQGTAPCLEYVCGACLLTHPAPDQRRCSDAGGSEP